MTGANHGIGRGNPATLLRGFRAATLVCALILAWFAFKPADGTESGLPWDKANHFLSFLVLTILSACGWPRRSPIVLALILVGVGVMIEVIQGTPLVRRDADVWDVVADAAGIGCAWAGLIAGALRSRLDRRP